MLKGLWSLTWLEIKIFVREPLGLVGTVGVPVAIVIFLGRIAPPATRMSMTPRSLAAAATVTVLVALLIALNAVLSLVTIIAIYREGGILKRLRATPLRSHTILTAHVLAKLLFTGLTLLLTLLAGARTHPAIFDGRLFGFMGALFISTVSLLSIGFLIASIVPTARFAQPIGEPDPLSHAPGEWALHARGSSAARHAGGVACGAADLCGFIPQRGMAARAVVRAPRGHRARSCWCSSCAPRCPRGCSGGNDAAGRCVTGWRHSCFHDWIAAMPALRAGASAVNHGGY